MAKNLWIAGQESPEKDLNVAGVDILPFGRIRYPGTISWLWGRITGGVLQHQQFFKTFKKLTYRDS